MDGALLSTIAGAVEAELVVKKSRFVAYVEPVASVAEADGAIARVRKRYWDARHHCVALIVGERGEQQRSSDDGEPAGTAGAPMLGMLRQRQLTDVVAVVTRYFGGVLLGTGGLVRAYSSALAQALDGAAVVRRMLLTDVTIDVPHAEAGRMDDRLRAWAAAHGAVFGEPEYGAAVRYRLAVETSDVGRLTEDVAAWSAGRLGPSGGQPGAVTVGEPRVVDVP